MDLNEVATFVRVVETGSFSKAAKQLGLPRSTVSRRVARLEEHLGVHLLRRTTRRMHLTEQGQAYFDKVSPAIRVVQDAGELAQELVGEMKGPLRITAPVDFGQDYLPDICRGFRERYPDILLQVDLSNRIVDLIAEGFDLAIRGGRLPDSGLIARRLDRTDSWLFASRAYLDAHPAPRALADLTRHPCILFNTSAPTQRWTMTHEDGREASVVVNGVMESNDFSFIRRLVAAGVGISLMPAFLGAAADGDELVRLLPGWCATGGALQVVMPSGDYISAKARAFRDYLVERLSPPPWRA